MHRDTGGNLVSNKSVKIYCLVIHIDHERAHASQRIMGEPSWMSSRQLHSHTIMSVSPSIQYIRHHSVLMVIIRWGGLSWWLYEQDVDLFYLDLKRHHWFADNIYPCKSQKQQFREQKHVVTSVYHVNVLSSYSG